MNKEIYLINDYNEIDLSGNAVIEASAGTGKTYTIENLVVKLLTAGTYSGNKKADITIDKILIVTYTEKATSELKEKIRTRLMQKNADADNDSIQDAIDNFNSANILTIHGFCMQIIKQYAFENKENFNIEVIDDSQLYQKTLYEIMRTRWKERYGDDLKDILQISDFINISKKKTLEYDYLNIAKLFKPESIYKEECKDLIIPEYNNRFNISDVKKEIKASLQELSRIIGNMDLESLEDSEFLRNFNDTKINKKKLGGLRNHILIPIFKMIITFVNADVYDYTLLNNFFDDIKKQNTKDRPDYLSYAISVIEESDNKILIKEFRDIIRILKGLQDIFYTALYQLYSNTIIDLKEQVYNFKKAQGLISYDDMLATVFLSIQNNPSLLKTLQDNYIYAFVDEFQDTDSVQWQIFKKIFADGKNNRLFVIGDPKQAIYGFRGADVFTYEKAKNYMIEKGANYYGLATNWRSTCELIDGFNKIFAESNWFTKSASNIPKASYQMISSPDKNCIQAKLNLQDQNGFKTINLIDIKNDINIGIAKGLYAKFISQEILNLLNNSEDKKIYYDKNINDYRHLTADDICILIRSNNDAPIIEDELKAKQIPYMFYKKRGLYQSNESLNLIYLFYGILDPANAERLRKALLTNFFNIKISDLWQYEDIPAAHEIIKLFDKWHNLAMQRNLAELFFSIMNDSKIMFREIKKPNSDRIITNYKQILHNIEEEASRNNMDFLDITQMLVNYYNNEIQIEEETQVHQIETENPKVQIMTIHASKGLDFPVVFIAGGFTNPVEKSYWYFHDKDNDNKVTYDLVKLDINNKKLKYKDEIQYENERLFYVALTRVKYKLYIPKYSPIKNIGGKNGPLTGFIYEALSNAFDNKEDPFITNINIKDYIDTNDDMLCYSGDKSYEYNSTSDANEIICPEEQLSFGNRVKDILSFSKINSKIQKKILFEENTYETDFAIINDEDEKIIEEESFVSLPAGNITGSMLHEILECIQFNKVNESSDHKALLNDPEVYQLLNDKLEKFYSFNKLLKSTYITNQLKFIEEAAKIIWHTLNTPLNIGTSIIRLSSIKDTDKIHELEFYYQKDLMKNLNIEIINHSKKDLITGIIDLVFRVNGKYYFLDWKSNTIKEGYTKNNIGKNMDDENYHLQHKIYSLAVNKWLKTTLKDKFEQTKHFGGFIYIYLRGMNVNEPDKGYIFYSGDDIIKEI